MPCVRGYLGLQWVPGVTSELQSGTLSRQKKGKQEQQQERAIASREAGLGRQAWGSRLGEAGLGRQAWLGEAGSQPALSFLTVAFTILHEACSPLPFPVKWQFHS